MSVSTIPGAGSGVVIAMGLRSVHSRGNGQIKTLCTLSSFFWIVSVAMKLVSSLPWLLRIFGKYMFKGFAPGPSGDNRAACWEWHMLWSQKGIKIGLPTAPFACCVLERVNPQISRSLISSS